MKTFRHIMVPVDFSTDSEEAIDVALSVFGEYADTISILTVYENMVSRHTEVVYGIDDVMLKSVQEEVDKFKLRFEDRHKNLQVIVKKGNPSSRIIETAKELDVDLIVMGSQGRNSFVKAFFGGTTYQVSRKAHCSVFVVRT